MAYCPKCGVEVEPGIRTCPLCSFDIPYIPGEEKAPGTIELKNYYKELKGLKKKRKHRMLRFVFFVFILMSFYTMIQVTYQDWSGDHSFSFALYVIFSLAIFILDLYLIFGLGKKVRLVFPLLMISTALFVFLIDLIEGGIEWFYTMGLPMVLIPFGILLLVLGVFSRFKIRGLYLVSLIMISVALLCFLLEVVIDLNTGGISLFWSLNIIVPLCSVSGILALIKRWLTSKRSSRLKRFFHL